MCNVLIMDDSIVERYLISKTLKETKEIKSDVFESDNFNQALELIDNKNFDLIISSMSFSTINLKHMLKSAKKKNPRVSIILTTVNSENHAIYNTSKLKADGYLLNPYTPQNLINEAKQVIKRQESTNQEIKENKVVYDYLQDFRVALENHRYKKCIDIAKVNINKIYESSQNTSEIRNKVSQMIIHIGEIAKENNLELAELIESEAKQYLLEFHKRGQIFNTYIFITDIINCVFDELDKHYIYENDINKALNYIDRNYRFGINLDQTAAYINMSPCYLSKLFKKVTGENFINYLTQEKINLAKEMLRHTNMPIINIAYELSYSETNYFSKAFKKNVGISPTEYRDTLVA